MTERVIMRVEPCVTTYDGKHAAKGRKVSHGHELVQLEDGSVVLRPLPAEAKA